MKESEASSPTGAEQVTWNLDDLVAPPVEGDVDLVMVGAVKNPYIARTIERTKQLLYAA